ncbi:MAG: NAD-dependent epimerase/dehydratase family protein [Sphingobacteriaceae bacterium]|nr:NAD-dependent epimerase/dehydratase family protein [Sphingobacteriaceae bacterium]
MISNKKILITGGAGFIGSNLCDHFISKNNFIICLDNLSTGKISNIEHLHTVYTHRRTILNAPSSSGALSLFEELVLSSSKQGGAKRREMNQPNDL